MNFSHGGALILCFSAAASFSTTVAFAAESRSSCSQIASGRASVIPSNLPFEIQSIEVTPNRSLSSSEGTLASKLKSILPPDSRLKLTKASLETLNATIINYENIKKNFKIETVHPNPDTFNVSFGKRLGFGMQGSVYSLNSITRSSPQGYIQTDLRLSGPSVIKFPHRLRTQTSPIAAAEAAIREEGATYQLLQNFENSELPKIQSRPEYPKNTYWSRGHLPVVPVLGAQSTTRGTFLIKPLVRGWNLKDLHKKYGAHIPSQMEDSLKMIYEALRVLDKEWPTLIQNGTRDGVLTGNRRTLDINPRNLMWIPDAEVESLKAAGIPIEREGFFLIEFAFAETDMPQISSWQAFKKEFDRALVEFK